MRRSDDHPGEADCAAQVNCCFYFLLFFWPHIKPGKDVEITRPGLIVFCFLWWQCGQLDGGTTRGESTAFAQVNCCFSFLLLAFDLPWSREKPSRVNCFFPFFLSFFSFFFSAEKPTVCVGTTQEKQGCGHHPGEMTMRRNNDMEKWFLLVYFFGPEVFRKFLASPETFDIVSDYFRNIITIQFRSTSLLRAISFSVLHSSRDCSLQWKPIGLFLLAWKFLLESRPFFL